MPGLSRATTFSVKFLGSARSVIWVLSLKAELICEKIPNGRKTSGVMRALMPLKPLGATPMTV